MNKLLLAIAFLLSVVAGNIYYEARVVAADIESSCWLVTVQGEKGPVEWNTSEGEGYVKYYGGHCYALGGRLSCKNFISATKC